MSEEVKDAKASTKAKPKGETKVEQGSEPLVKAQQNNKPVKREVLPDGTIVEHF